MKNTLENLLNQNDIYFIDYYNKSAVSNDTENFILKTNVKFLFNTEEYNFLKKEKYSVGFKYVNVVQLLENYPVLISLSENLSKNNIKINTVIYNNRTVFYCHIPKHIMTLLLLKGN